MRPEEVTKAREYAAGSFPIRLEAKTDVAAVLLDAEAAGHGVDYIETYGSRIRAQTLEAIEAGAGAFANPARLVVVIAGSFGDD